jgi:hypothetical protein
MGHEKIALGKLWPVAIEDIKRRDRTRRRRVGRLGELILGNECTDRLQIRTRYHGKAIVLEDSTKLSQRRWYLVRVEVLDVVA